MVAPENLLSVTDDVVFKSVAPVCWAVRLKAAAGNVSEEAHWLVNIAISLLRFHIPVSTQTALHPGIGDVEASPTRPWEGGPTGVTIRANGVNINSIETPRFYVINDAVKDVIEAEQFQELASAIFDPPLGTVAERLHQGLGWLSRSRQTRDRSERLLLLFTSLEALLSGHDPNASVVNTVAKNLSVLWCADAKDRKRISDQIKQLYDVRSLLVHTGKRAVSNSHTRTAQRIAETVYWLVLHRVDVSRKLKDFHQDLHEASFGLPWVPDFPKEEA